MADFEFQNIRDVLDIPLAGESVEHYGYQVSGDFINLPQVPKISTTALNTWVDLATAEAYFTTAEVYSGGGWVALTATDTLPVTTTQYYLHIADKPYSNRLYVHADHQEKQFHFVYTGIGTLVAAYIMQALQNAINESIKGFPRLYSEGYYAEGRYDASMPDTQRIRLVLPSAYFQFLSNNVVGVSLWLNFAVAQVLEIGAFTNADYWKRILLYAYDDAGSFDIDKIESAESATQGALVTPDRPSTDHYYLGYFDVQNNGTTGLGGEFLDIEQDNIVTEFSKYISTRGMEPTRPYEWKVWGNPITTEILDNTFYPSYDGEIVSGQLSCRNTGTGGDDLRLDIMKNGVSLFTADGDKPTITANSGTNQVTALDVSKLTSASFTSSDYIDVQTDQVPIGCENVNFSIEIQRI